MTYPFNELTHPQVNAEIRATWLPKLSRPEFGNLGGEGIRQANPIKLLVDFNINCFIKRNLRLLV